MGYLSSQDWVDLAVALLLEDVNEPEVAELAGFGRDVSDWYIAPLVEALYERHGVAVPDDETSVVTLAGLVSADLRARPAPVTDPMIRILARLAPSDFESPLANKCYSEAEYLDCMCAPRAYPTLEVDLEALPGPPIPGAVVELLAQRLRSTLPLVQPPHGH